MGRAFGILLIVAVVWVGLEIYGEGMHGAFGGALASFSSGSEPAAEERTLPKRAGDRVEGAHAAANARRERLLND